MKYAWIAKHKSQWPVSLSFLPGEEMQVDYGEGAPTLVPGTDRYKKPRLFVATLRHSRRSFRRVVWKSSQQVWAQLHEQAFRYFGGCPQYVVLDNLKEGVIKPDLYEPELNPVYEAMLDHYGVVADPARVRDPNRKGTVEHAISHTQATALKGKCFESIEAQNKFLEHWETNWAAKRIHGTERQQVQAMFEAERAHLKPLPLLGMQYFTQGVRTVCDDSRVAKDLLEQLREQGLDLNEPRLWVIDGSKALASAVNALCGEAAHVQRCQIHKIRNVTERLPKDMPEQVAWRMKSAFGLQAVNGIGRLKVWPKSSRPSTLMRPPACSKVWSRCSLWPDWMCRAPWPAA